MRTHTTDNPDLGRYELYVDDELVGFADYTVRDGTMAIPHTEVRPAYRGRGLAGILIRDTLDAARSRGLAVLPYCPFVSDFIGRNAGYRPLVPPDQLARFGLRPAGD